MAGVARIRVQADVAHLARRSTSPLRRGKHLSLKLVDVSHQPSRSCSACVSAGARMHAPARALRSLSMTRTTALRAGISVLGSPSARQLDRARPFARLSCQRKWNASTKAALASARRSMVESPSRSAIARACRNSCCARS